MKFTPEIMRKIYSKIQSQAPVHVFVSRDPFWMLITTVLSQRTKDAETDRASLRLREKFPGISDVANADVKEISRLIYGVGFYNVKAKEIKEIASRIMKDFNGKVPEDRDTLMSLPGVGRKTANIVLAESLGKPAIAVDTHVQRISWRLGITKSKDPEKTEEALEKIVPIDLWIGFNPTLVEFGKSICKPVSPRCDICSISEYCEYYKKLKK
ncbi:MAG: endonuclease III domain-containing protein [Thermoplasmata archaeon]